MKNIYSFLFVFVLVLFSSCLKGGLDDLPVYEDANILTVTKVAYRYISDEKSPASGQFIVKQVNLTYDSDVNIETGKVKIEVTAPDDFPSAELANLSKSNLIISVSLSTAARLIPINNSPKLGIPGDWSKLNTYAVTAASGKERIWTIEVISFKK